MRIMRMIRVMGWDKMKEKEGKEETKEERNSI